MGTTLAELKASVEGLDKRLGMLYTETKDKNNVKLNLTEDEAMKKAIAAAVAAALASASPAMASTERRLEIYGGNTETNWAKLTADAKFSVMAKACEGTDTLWTEPDRATADKAYREIARRKMTLAQAQELIKTCDIAELIGSGPRPDTTAGPAVIQLPPRFFRWDAAQRRHVEIFPNGKKR